MQFNSTAALVAVLWIASSALVVDATASQSKVYSDFSAAAQHSGSEIAGMHLMESDIFVGRVGTGSSSALLRGISLSNSLSLWLDGIVPYEIDAGVTEHGREVVQNAIAHWNQNSTITLVDRAQTPDTGPDFVRFIAGPGCASWVGRQGGAQEVWVSNFCTSGSMIHEVGHALGLLHEHTRSDRDQFIEVQWSNIQSDKIFNFEISSSGTQDLGPYDYDSVMHYGEYFFSNNGDRTIRAIGDIGSSVIGQRVAASPGDLAAIGRLYQTDLALSMQEFDNGGVREIQLLVTNQGGNGAHDVEVLITGAGEIDSFSGDSGWNCVADEAQTVCTLPRLSASANAQINVQLQPESGDAISSFVSAKTHDNDLSNNQGGDGPAPLPVPQPQPAAALGEAQGDDRVTTASAAGSVDPLLLLLLLVPLGLMRREAVLACTGSMAAATHTHASSDSSTSSG